MKTIDQVESLTEEAHRTAESQNVWGGLPEQDVEAQSLKDLIAQDKAEVENTVARSLLRALTWAMFVVALGVVALLVRAVARGYIR